MAAMVTIVTMVAAVTPCSRVFGSLGPLAPESWRQNLHVEHHVSDMGPSEQSHLCEAPGPGSR